MFQDHRETSPSGRGYCALCTCLLYLLGDFSSLFLLPHRWSIRLSITIWKTVAPTTLQFSKSYGPYSSEPRAYTKKTCLTSLPRLHTKTGDRLRVPELYNGSHGLRQSVPGGKLIFLPHIDPSLWHCIVSRVMWVVAFDVPGKTQIASCDTVRNAFITLMYIRR